MALDNGILKAVALQLAVLLSLFPSSCQGESIALMLQHDQRGLCFGQPVLLLCQHPDVTSGMFRTTKPSWRENGAVFAIDGGMYRSMTQINETHTVLELVPERSHFEPSEAHDYTCFLRLVGGGELESNSIQISPIKKLLNVVQVNETSVKIKWDHSRACFEDCDITFNLTWTPSDRAQSGSIETNDTMHFITSLERDEAYEATLTALCRGQSQVAMVSRTVVITFNTSSEMDISPVSHLESSWPVVIGVIVGFATLFTATVILIISLSICTVVVKRKKSKSESMPNDKAKENVTGLSVHVYDTVSSVTEGVQFQANPSYTPIMQNLQTPTGTVSMQANPSYITISGLTEA